MLRACFISIEDEGIDLILSFALEDEKMGVRSLILMRTAVFESIMPAAERGVRVSLEGGNNCDDEILVRVVLSSEKIKNVTKSVSYKVNLSRIDAEELQSLAKFLQKMNFDNKFEIRHS